MKASSFNLKTLIIAVIIILIIILPTEGQRPSDVSAIIS